MPSVSPSGNPTTAPKCFDADDGGLDGVLFNAVRAYVNQDCANNKDCDIAQVYGWPMNSWCVGNVRDMSWLFSQMNTFNEDISDWNTSSVTRMRQMFDGASSFNGDVSNFDTSSVTKMLAMFRGATSFNGDLSNFDTSSVTDMNSMFSGASSFNGDLSNFNTSSVTYTNSMFQEATAFNQDVSNFDTSSVNYMNGMFYGATSFNQDVSNFDISSIFYMNEMFYGATSFNKDLCSWRDNFPYTTKTDNIFTDSGCTYQDRPQEAQKGPFCASDCVKSVSFVRSNANNTFSTLISYLVVVLVQVMVVLVVFFTLQFVHMLVKTVLIIKNVLLDNNTAGLLTRGVLEMLKTCQICFMVWILLMRISMGGIRQVLLI